jgi:hypothetical protein
MDDYSANAPGVWLAQNDPSLNGVANDPSTQPYQPQEAGAADQYSETNGGDYENGGIPRDAASPGTETGDPSQGASVDSGAQSAGSPPPEQPIMDAATTPPPPPYGGEVGSPTAADGDGLSHPGVNGQDSAYPMTGDTPAPTQPTIEGQTATPSGMPEGLASNVEPPLGLLPIIVFGLATVIGVIIYLSRRGKNWAEISESIRDEGGGGSHPESRIVTQFSEIQDMKGTRHTQNSMQVSGFE